MNYGLTLSNIFTSTKPIPDAVYEVCSLFLADPVDVKMKAFAASFFFSDAAEFRVKNKACEILFDPIKKTIVKLKSDYFGVGGLAYDLIDNIDITLGGQKLVELLSTLKITDRKISALDLLDHYNTGNTLTNAIDEAYSFNKDTSTIGKLLKGGANVDMQLLDSDGKIITPLVYSIRYGTYESTRLLLEHGADVNAQSENNPTALLTAIELDKSEVVDLLLEHGADVKQRGKEHFDALGLALTLNNPGLTELTGKLLDRDAKLNSRYNNGLTPLLMACESDLDPAIIEQLIKAGANLNLKTRSGQTALMLSAESGKLAIVELLTEYYSDLDRTDRKGNTAVIFAAKAGHSQVVKKLVQMGAEPYLENKQGESAFSLMPDLVDEIQRNRELEEL